MLLVLLVGLVLPAAAQPAASASGPQTVVEWNRIARRVNFTVGGQNPIAGLVYIAYTQAAVYNAAAAVDGRYQQYKANLARRPDASIDAAIATAAHDVLAHYFPAQKPALDADLANSLAAIPDGTAKVTGRQVGSEAAAGIIALREGDGRNADIGFTMPPPAPGVWQLPAGQSPLTPWLSKFRPFLLQSPDQFRIGPPPELTSAAWAKNYNEVKLMGGTISDYRTPEQSLVARFWGVQPTIQTNLTLERAALTRGLDAMQAARLFAMGNLVGADALVACFDSKYHYLFWRPTFAVPQGDTDGNPATAGDPNWTPLVPNPPHPEYPSAHGCMTGSQAAMYAMFFGTEQIDVDISAVLDGQEIVRHFNTSEDLRRDVINGRVWGGVHYRESAIKGTVIARQVAHWTLRRYFLPAN
jgi:hypothetical protein